MHLSHPSPHLGPLLNSVPNLTQTPVPYPAFWEVGQGKCLPQCLLPWRASASPHPPSCRADPQITPCGPPFPLRSGEVHPSPSGRSRRAVSLGGRSKPWGWGYGGDLGRRRVLGPGGSSRTRVGEIYKSENEVTRQSSGFLRVPHHLPSGRDGAVAPHTYQGHTHIHRLRRVPVPTRPRSVTACVTRPHSATRSLSHSPSHIRCHTQCLTPILSFSSSALALWHHLEVSEQLGNSLSCAQGLVPWAPKCSTSI